MYDNDLEWFLLFLVKLLWTGYLFDQLLNNDLIMVVGLAWGHFDVVIRWEHDALNRSWARCTGLELFELWFDLVDCICLVKLLEQAFDQRSLTASRRAVEQNVGKVIGFGQFWKHVDLVLVHGSSGVKLHRPVLFHPKALLSLLHIFEIFKLNCF